MDSDPLENLPPDELIQALRAEIARSYGWQYAKKCEIQYESNNYFVRSPTQSKDGKLYVSGPRRIFYRSQILWIIDLLKARRPKKRFFLF